MEELSEEEFLNLDDENKWRYIQDLLTKVEELQIKADKNCSECKKYMISPLDLNIQYFMEDWRDCRKDCDNCTKSNLKQMCEAQYQIINYITNELITLRNRQNGLTELILKRENILQDFKEEIKKNEERDEISQDLYL